MRWPMVNGDLVTGSIDGTATVCLALLEKSISKPPLGKDICR